MDSYQSRAFARFYKLTFVRRNLLEFRPMAAMLINLFALKIVLLQGADFHFLQ